MEANRVAPWRRGCCFAAGAAHTGILCRRRHDVRRRLLRTWGGLGADTAGVATGATWQLSCFQHICFLCRRLPNCPAAAIVAILKPIGGGTVICFAHPVAGRGTLQRCLHRMLG